VTGAAGVGPHRASGRIESPVEEQSFNSLVIVEVLDVPQVRDRAPNLHAHVGAAVSNLRHVEYFHDHQRIERLFFDGTLDPSGGSMRPDQDRPGHGMALRSADTERYRRG
jgi:hypothetical protein